MPSDRSDSKVSVELNGEKFSINGYKMLDGSYRIKLGRSLSKKKPYATLTEIFNLSRKWAVGQVNKPTEAKA